jgi:exodeoxyribonuclease VII large subunit
VLERGYALVQTGAGDVVRSKDGVKAGEGVTLTFADGKREAVIEGTVAKKTVKKKPSKPATSTPQGDLF